MKRRSTGYMSGLPLRRWLSSLVMENRYPPVSTLVSLKRIYWEQIMGKCGKRPRKAIKNPIDGGVHMNIIAGGFSSNPFD